MRCEVRRDFLIYVLALVTIAFGCSKTVTRHTSPPTKKPDTDIRVAGLVIPAARLGVPLYPGAAIVRSTAKIGARAVLLEFRVAVTPEQVADFYVHRLRPKIRPTQSKGLDGRFRYDFTYVEAPDAAQRTVVTITPHGPGGAAHVRVVSTSIR